MAKGKKTGGRDFKPGNLIGRLGGRPSVPAEIRTARGDMKLAVERLIMDFLAKPHAELKALVSDPQATMLEVMIAKLINKAANDADVMRIGFLLDRVIGKVPTYEDLTPPTLDVTPGKVPVFSFEDFCEAVGYFRPYPKQVDMVDFAIKETEPRLILGARGYGKSDYAVVLGVAHEIYLARNGAIPKQPTTLILTKSKERNAAMLREIAQSLSKVNVPLEIENATALRVEGLIGKDHSVSAATIKSVTLRGRHPDRVIMDDPVTPDDMSPATRELVQRVYNEVNKLTPNVLVIGQPVHQLDLYGKLRHLLKKLEMPHGTIPELDADLEAQRLAGVDEASISASYHLVIKSDGGLPFEDLKTVDRYPIGDASVAFLDPSNKGRDFTAVTVATAYGQGVAFVGNAWRKAWEHCLDDLVAMLVKYKVKRLAFETNATGDYPVEILRQLFAKKGLAIGVVPIFSTTNKHSRIMAAGAMSKQLFIAERESGKPYVDQTRHYEYNAPNDDAPDSLASLLTWLGLIRGK